MASFIIGRGDDDDVVSVGGGFKNVSRRHLEITLEDGGRCRVVDLGSVNGTEVLERGRWQPIRKAVVSLDHRLRLGHEYEASVREFLGLAQKQHGARRQPGRTEESPDGISLRACPSCGAPAQGEVCAACGERLVLNAPGLANIIADMLGEDKRGYLPTLVGLLTAPVRTSLKLARDRSFNLHGVFFAMSIGLYIFLVRALSPEQEGKTQDQEAQTSAAGALNHPAPNPDATLAASPDASPVDYIMSVLEIVDNFIPRETLIGILFYVTFLLKFVINFYVFKDYSSATVAPRAYLKLSCLATFIYMVALIVLFVPVIAAMDEGDGSALSERYAVPIFLILLVAFIVFTTQYAIRTATGFWNISTVSAFRGIVVSWVLAIIVVWVGSFCLVLIVTAFTERF